MRAEGLLRPALNAVRHVSHQHGWPVRLLQTLSALNAASLCGMHLAAGKPAAAWQAGSYALEMESLRGDGDNPVGLRLSMAAAAYMLGRHSASVTLLRQAARVGLLQLRGLQGHPSQAAARPGSAGPADGRVGGGAHAAGESGAPGAGRKEASSMDGASSAPTSIRSSTELAAWVRRQLEPSHERQEGGAPLSAEALESKLGAAERYAALSDAERQLLVGMLQHAMIVAYLHLARCFKAQGRHEHWSSALAHAARLCEAGGASTSHLLPSVMATLNQTTAGGGHGTGPGRPGAVGHHPTPAASSLKQQGYSPAGPGRGTSPAVVSRASPTTRAAGGPPPFKAPPRPASRQAPVGGRPKGPRMALTSPN